VSGQIDRIYHVGDSGRDALLARAQDEARAEAERAGADPARTEIVELEELPLAYLTTPSVRVRVKAAGPLLS
jgi:pyruvate/2-oxoglutarate dehydrogenase complex dihydrolipoamide dehydrogenase (E3) component